MPASIRIKFGKKKEETHSCKKHSQTQVVSLLRILF